MEYFKYFPKITSYMGYKNARNVLARSKIRELVLKNSVYVFDYVIKDGERADIIADREYGHPRYAWVIYYANNIVDPLTQWPMDYACLQTYIKNKYGSLELAMTTPHHYLYKEKYIIDKLAYDATSFLFYTPDSGINFTGYPVGDTVQLYKNGVAQEGKTATVIQSNAVYTETTVGTLTGFTLGENGADSWFLYSAASQIGTSEERIAGCYNSADLKSVVSCYDYETTENDNRRNIKLIRSGYVARIADEFKRIYDV